MITRFVVLCGFEGKALDSLRTRLSSLQFEVIYVKHDADIATYTKRLLERLKDVLAKISADAKAIGLLVSCLHSSNSVKEDEAFFPLLRKKKFPVDCRRDINKVKVVSGSIEQTFKSSDFLQFSRDFNKPVDERLLLPPKNCKSTKLNKVLQAIYDMECLTLSSDVDKEIVRVKGIGSWRIRGVDFKGAQNTSEHPIRRCSDTVYCDLAATIRFGFRVNERFEFDVSCESGLKGKSFTKCDGSVGRVNKQVTHLNMRINDDFALG